MDNKDPLQYIPEPEHHELLPEHTLPERRDVPPFMRRGMFWAVAIVAFLLIVTLAAISAPTSFPGESVMTVEKGETLSGISGKLSDARIVRSEFLFKAFFTLFGGSKGLKAGDYYLESPQTVIRMAWRLSHAKYDLKNLRVTIPEGTSTAEIASIFEDDGRFAHFDSAEFIRIAAKHEGYLFPDTYLFLPSITAEGVFDAMRATFDRRIKELEIEIAAFDKPLSDIITMASIVEEEARTEETRRTIAGILWKRLDIGMPLQVDAAFAFVNGKKKSEELTLSDLAIASPYNTYVNRGLPPTPISNPGLDSISATVRPIATKYFFYLSDKNGDMHYAVTNAEHEANKYRYLR